MNKPRRSEREGYERRKSRIPWRSEQERHEANGFIMGFSVGILAATILWIALGAI